MRKKIFSAILVAIIAFAAGWNVYQSQAEITLSDLALSNIEALARREEFTVTCNITEGACWEKTYELCFSGPYWGYRCSRTDDPNIRCYECKNT